MARTKSKATGEESSSRESTPCVESPPPYPGLPTKSRNFVGNDQVVNMEDPGNLLQNGGASSSSAAPRTRTLLHEADKATRNQFLRMVYLTLTVQGLLIDGIIAAHLYWPLLKDYYMNLSSWRFWLYWIVALTVSTSFSALNHLMRLAPMNLVMLGIITACTGGLLGSISVYFDLTLKILVSVGTITAICALLVICSFIDFIPKCQLTPKVNIGLSWTFSLIAFGFLCIPYSVGEAFRIFLVPLCFVTYLGAVFQLVIRNSNALNVAQNLMSDEILFGTTSILMLAVNVVRNFTMKVIPCCRPCATCVGTVTQNSNA